MRKGVSILGAVIAMLAFANGCHAPTTGEVSGKATFQGQPIGWGTIAMIDAKEVVGSGVIRAGLYKIPKAPLGPCKVTVIAHPPPPQLAQFGSTKATGNSSQPAAFVPLPERYQDPEKSGLSFTVKTGQQVYDIDLKP